MSVDTAQFVENAASCLTEKQLDYSGRVLYAGRALLVRGDVYIVGKNPGAWTDEKTSDDPTVCSIREDLRRWAEERPDDYCAPRDDSTSNPQLVKGCKAVLRFVGADPWRVVSSNVIFGRGALLTVIPRIISDLRLDEADRQRNATPRDHPLRVCVALRVLVLIDDELSRASCANDTTRRCICSATTAGPWSGSPRRCWSGRPSTARISRSLSRGSRFPDCSSRSR